MCRLARRLAGSEPLKPVSPPVSGYEDAAEADLSLPRKQHSGWMGALQNTGLRMQRRRTLGQLNAGIRTLRIK